MPYEQKPDFGVLFKNDRKEKDNQPDYTGDYTTPDGQKRRIAAWVKEGKNGKYMSLRFSDPQQRREPPADYGAQEPKPEQPEFDDIPF